MVNNEGQKQLLEQGLNIKDYFLLQFLSKAPRELKLEIVSYKDSAYYEIKLSQILEALPLLEVGERQLQKMLQKLEEAGYINRGKSRFSFLYEFRHELQFASQLSDTNYSSPLNFQTRTTVRLSAPDTNYSSPLNDEISDPEVDNINTYNANINYSAHAGARVLNNTINNIIDEEDLLRSSTNINNINNTRTCAREEDIRAIFAKAFPSKNTYLREELPEYFNIQLLIDKINESDFLKTHNELGLNWCVKKYDSIINNYYKTFYKPKEQRYDFNIARDMLTHEYSEDYFENMKKTWDSRLNNMQMEDKK